MYIDHNSHISLWLGMMEGQESWTLCWHSFSRWGRESFALSFAYKGSQYSVYDNLQPVTPQISQDTWPTFVDTHFPDGAERVSVTFLPMEAANNSIMTVGNQLAAWLPRKHDQESLTLRWCSFCHGCIHYMQSFGLVWSIIHIVLVAILVFSFTFFLITTLFFNNTYK